jgi:hypothetical protein
MLNVIKDTSQVTTRNISSQSVEGFAQFAETISATAVEAYVPARLVRVSRAHACTPVVFGHACVVMLQIGQLVGCYNMCMPTAQTGCVSRACCVLSTRAQGVCACV